MKKLIIQIPCFNEEETLGQTLSELPRKLDGIEKVEWLIINDGSTDGTTSVAEAHGVNHIINLPHNLGLARGFMVGIEESLRLGADIIVNTDADNQYRASDIPKLLAPILHENADMVIGARPVTNITHFSTLKKMLQLIGSWVVRVISGTDVKDAPSGFRAISRDAAMRLNVLNTYTYTLETIIQAGRKNMRVVSVDVGVNGDLRPSRLVKSTLNYVAQSIITILRIFMIYRPLKFFMILGTIPFSIGFIIGLRWLFLFWFFLEPGRTHVPSLILAAILMLIGFQTYVLGLVAHLLSVNRTLLEEVRLRLRRAELKSSK
ncbi:MAG: glycosyl transferase [Magnetovibrio sp.]|nr:glycosyl transferase [Magnetovibrio sp.]|tara:strand:- start:4572 stop:5528 length:957 start_codon:yes stop_codon:yes gene_type:complete